MISPKVASYNFRKAGLAIIGIMAVRNATAEKTLPISSSLIVFVSSVLATENLHTQNPLRNLAMKNIGIDFANELERQPIASNSSNIVK